MKCIAITLEPGEDLIAVVAVVAAEEEAEGEGEAEAPTRATLNQDSGTRTIQQIDVPTNLDHLYATMLLHPRQ